MWQQVRRWLAANRNRLPLFKNMPDVLLVFLGSIAAIVVWFLNQALEILSPMYFSAVQNEGWIPAAIPATLTMLVIGALFIFSGAIAGRCGFLLGQRHLQ